MSAIPYTHDALVIGAGAAGLTAAGGCALFGLSVALIEEGAMGGECLNTGCVPSKALLAAAARAAQQGERLGVNLGNACVDWAGVRAHVDAAIAAIEHHDSQERFEAMGVEVIRKRASFLSRDSLRAGERTLRAPRIVIATGSRPAELPIEGIEKVPFLTNENLFQLDELPRHLGIVGAGAIGMEMAQAFRRLGSEVTVIAPTRPMERDDEEAAALVKTSLEREGVRFVCGEVGRISGAAGELRIDCSSGGEIAASHVLVAAGRKANVDSLDLAKAGVAIGDNGIVVDARRRTSNKRIYAIGDCRAGPRFTHVSGYEGSNVALEIALGIPAKADFSALPHCTFTSPELAQVGMTEDEARKRHDDKVRIIRQDFADNDRAVCEGRSEGFLKLVMKGSKVLGVTAVGEHAGELLLPWSQVIAGKGSTFAMGSAVVAYPMRSDLSKQAAFTAWEPTVFGSWPRRIARVVARSRRLGR
jgi:pyruvate/2-oxoglutarate dehydrogenase complex dihydrolipoamide dehydrogenase (E3) component